MLQGEEGKTSVNFVLASVYSSKNDCDIKMNGFVAELKSILYN